MFNKIIISIPILFLLTLLILTFCGCDNSNSAIFPFDTTPSSDSINSTIIIEEGAEITKDCTPTLTVYAENAINMSFSGDGINWTDWFPYSPVYNNFNIAIGLNGTIFSSGVKTVYVKFLDSEGSISPIDNFPFDSIQYEMQDLHFIKIIPKEVTISTGSSFSFTVHGYDLGGKNEVPLEESEVTWTKYCEVGKLSPTTGLSTTYTAPIVSGERNISAYNNNLGAGATILVVNND